MKQIILLTSGLFSMIILGNAQESRFFIPREIKAAYEQGTRSYDGKPGDQYWQNTVDYTISAKITPETRELTGSESVVFHNNSPGDLNILVIRLYHDLFKKGNQRGSRVRPEDVNDGVEISKLVVDGVEINIEEKTRRSGTNLIVTLNEPIKKQSSANIEIDWNMIIPETTIRTGAYDSTSFFVAYWYPQIAVYDDIFGWDFLSYDFSTEFYNNLGNYDVTLEVPEQFTVLATGELQNAEEVFKPEKHELYEKARSSNETVTIISTEDVNNNYTHAKGKWHYVANNVTDFSFCMSDHFVWDGAVQEVGDRNVFISSFYNIKVAEAAATLTGVQQKTMKHLSEDMPGIPYPYPEFTTCVMGGGGGMETPMMANNGSPGRGVTIHEMFHTYFPMYVRINEKRFAWMDEGWANFNTAYIDNRYFDGETNTLVVNAAQIQGTIGTVSDLPMVTSSQFLDNTNYGYASYPLPAFLYAVLHHHLGDELFKKCYQDYISNWAGKSPTPYDFFYTFERVSGQDLSWFWKPWFFSYGTVDISISSFKKGKLNLKNNGNRPVPLIVSVMYNDSTTWETDHSAAIWNSGDEFTVEIPDYKEVAFIGVNQVVPDINIMDNYHPTLEERYGDFKIADKYLGTYKVDQFPLNVIIYNEDGLVKFSLTGTGINSFLLPVNEYSFKDLSGNYAIDLNENEDGSIGVSLKINSFGLTLIGKKE